ncbi:tRNA pseudouridine(38-40) synthase TruA [Vallitaleaceae bacterium 9-2]
MSEQKYYKLTIAYEGTNYCGWQLQKNSVSIHEVLMKAGRAFLPDDFSITGGSRTDSGVHALGYVALLKTTYDKQAYRICRAFNAYLPKDVVVYESQEVAKDFHPRYSAKGKHYRYTIYNDEYALPQYMHYAYYYHARELDAQKMQEAAQWLVGRHDFMAYSSKKTSVEDTVRTLYECCVTREHKYIHIDVKGDGFLYNMVRIIAGMLIEVGRGKIEPRAIKKILEEKDRMKATKTAPANGLTLMEIYYS